MSTRWLLAFGCALALPVHAQDAMPGMDMPAPPQSAAPTRSADYSDGYRYGSMPGMEMLDDSARGMLLLDQLEYVHADRGGDAAFVDGEAWYGKDFDKLWLKFEGHSGDSLRTEALWDHAVVPFWDTQLGLRHDSGNGPDRTWIAFGVQGLAPWRIETEATIYLGENGRSAARLQLEYEALLTQHLILQPKFEMNLYGRDDPQRGTGSGLSDAGLGLRLRYEITRQFAPYLGVVWQQRYGRSADVVRARGEHPDQVQFVAGVRVWF
ncbi:MAG TPA: copper resistance protein B [Rhodanobacteraceae bacterium]|nr:copper resistance protein B [Rhodanobacteraceae bacterium]